MQGKNGAAVRHRGSQVFQNQVPLVMSLSWILQRLGQKKNDVAVRHQASIPASGCKDVQLYHGTVSEVS